MRLKGECETLGRDVSHFSLSDKCAKGTGE